MAIVRSFPTEKYIGNRRIITSQSAVVSEEVYTTTGEDYIIIKKIDSCKVKLDSVTTDHITVKALTKVLIIPDKGLIDEEYEEVFIDKGACVEFVFCVDNWYIVSSDGLKLD